MPDSLILFAVTQIVFIVICKSNIQGKCQLFNHTHDVNCMSDQYGKNRKSCRKSYLSVITSYFEVMRLVY